MKTLTSNDSRLIICTSANNREYLSSQVLLHEYIAQTYCREGQKKVIQFGSQQKKKGFI